MTGLSLALLDPLQVMRDGAPVTAFESDKVRALLAYLAVEAERPHRRDALAGLLWPDRPERTAHLNLNQALANRANLLQKTGKLKEAVADLDKAIEQQPTMAMPLASVL